MMQHSAFYFKERAMHMLDTFKKVASLFKICRKTLIIFEVIYKFAGLVVFAPVFLLMLRLTMIITGHRYLANSHIVSYLTNPVTISMLIVTFLVLGVYFLFETGCISAVLEAANAGERIGVASAFYVGRDRLKIVFSRKRVPLFLNYMFIYPFLNVSVLGVVFMNFAIPDAIINAFWSKIFLYLAVILVVFLLFAASVRNIFILPCSFHEEKSFDESVSRSKSILKGHVLKVIGSVLLWNAFVLLVIAALKLVTALIIIAGVRILDATSMGIALYLTVMKLLDTSITLVLLLLTSVSSYMVISGMYFKFGVDGEPVPVTDEVKACIQNPKKWPVRRSIIVVTTGVAAVLLTVTFIFIRYNNNPFQYVEILSIPEITAHRGSSLRAPENTMSSFALAEDELADYVELDVHLTYDGIPVCLHDDDLKRVAGVPIKIWNITYDAVSRIDIGKKQGFLKYDHVPAFEAVMESFEGKIKFNIEVKTGKNEPKLVEKVVRIIEEYDMVDDCIITSKDYSALKEVKRLNPDIRTGYILAAAYGSYYGIDDVDVISINYNYVSKSMVDAVHDKGKEVHVWTVNKPSRIKSLANMGVDNIITDDPVAAREAVYSRYTTRGMINILNYVFGRKSY